MLKNLLFFLIIALGFRLSSATPNLTESFRFAGYEGLSPEELRGDVWIMSGRVEIADKHAKVSISDSVYWEQVNIFGEFFRIRNDSVFWKGFNRGRRFGCLADSPINLSAKDRQRYAATCKLDGSFTLSVKGDMEWSEIGRGTVVLSPTDTLKDVRLTRLLRTVEVEDEEGLMVDSIISYRWYVSGLSIPVAIQTDGVLYTIASEKIEDILTEEDSKKEVTKKVSDIISNAEFDYSGSKITISLSEPLEAEAYIMDLSGNTYGRVSGLKDKFVLRTDGLSPKTYLVAIRSTQFPECVYEILFNITE